MPIASMSSSKLRSRTAMLVVSLVLIWLIGFFWFLAQIPSPRDLSENALPKADAIVVLTGGSGRVEHGMLRLLEGSGDVLFISGVGAGAGVEEVLIFEHGNLLLPDGYQERVVLGHEATDTIGNAMEVAAWAKENQIRSIALVTSNYHMPRSLMELHETMPDVMIMPDPVFSKRVKMAGWIDAPGSARLLLLEYHKYLLRWAYFLIKPFVGDEVRLVPKQTAYVSQDG